MKSPIVSATITGRVSGNAAKEIWRVEARNYRSKNMFERRFAVSVHREDGGTGPFEYCLEDVDCSTTLLNYFGFLGLPIVEAVSFVSDYQISLQSGQTEVVVHNDDWGNETLGTDAKETVYFSVRAANEIDGMRVQKKLEETFRMVRLE